MHRPPLVALALAGALALVGCAAAGGVRTPSPSSTVANAWQGDCGPGLRADLLRMFEDDQAGRTGGDDPASDQIRTDRLKTIVVRCGWPGTDLVGEDGEDAAWTIAQHSDLDPAFQSDALDLLREAVEQGRASPGNLAYLEDRVLVGRGDPQRYGTQLGCGPDGPEPAVGLVDPDRVDERRADAGLEPLQDYYDSLGPEFCSPEPPEPPEPSEG